MIDFILANILAWLAVILVTLYVLDSALRYFRRRK